MGVVAAKEPESLMDASRAERDTERLLYLGLLGHDFSVIAGRVLRRFFVVSKMITIILPSNKTCFPCQGETGDVIRMTKMWRISKCGILDFAVIS